MKLNLTTKFLSAAIAMLFSIGVIAQPANDNVCDAIDLTGGMDGFVMSNDGATVQAGEEMITPPSGGCLPGIWCDQTGIDNSIWFKFDAPADGSVIVSGCLSDFDNQIAVYEVGNCSDFTTFTYIWGADDTDGDAGCGVDASESSGRPYSLSSSFTLDCLTAGQTYYVLVDGWQNSAGDAVIVGAIDMEVTAITPTNTATVIETISTDPECMGGSNGSASFTITEGRPPFSYSWSTGSDSTAITGISAGDYMVSVTDACGDVTVATITLDDGPAPTQIVIDDNNSIVHPSNCDDGTISSGSSGNDGQIGIGISSGTAPFVYTWSNGNSTAYISGLAPGDYTVTVEDACGNIAATETYTLNAAMSSTDNATPAGEDVELCGDNVQIGGGSSSGLGQLSQITYSTNQTLDGNVACRSTTGAYTQNSYWRAFDLANDFNLSGIVNIEAVDLPFFAQADPASNGLQEVSVALYTVSSLDLSTATRTQIATTTFLVADMNPDYFRVNIEAAVDASEILAIEFNHPGSPAGLTNFFDVRSNATTTTQPTYISSTACGGLSTPTLMTDIGYPNQVVMNLIYRTNDASTYTWDDPNGGLSSTMDAMPTASQVGTYSVTVTDVCGNSVVDEVMVDLCIGILSPEESTFTIAPNPSNGIFQLQNTEIAKDITLQVFDLQGKMIQTQQFNGTTHTLDLSPFPASIYVLKLDNGIDIETHKLIVY